MPYGQGHSAEGGTIFQGKSQISWHFRYFSWCLYIAGFNIQLELDF
jgi:hypothetical protein